MSRWSQRNLNLTILKLLIPAYKPPAHLALPVLFPGAK